jgi:hypothetical protein
MSIGSVSFWQQDQNYWAKAQQSDQTQSLSSTVISNMFSASSTLTTGLASIANQTALDRTNTALSAAVQSALQSETGGSSSSSSSTGSSSTSSSTPAPASAPASGTGTAPVSTSTSLFTLGILAKGTLTVSDGSNETTYKSTGADTVGDLINTINANLYGNAKVAAGLDGSGRLVFTSLNDTDPVIVGGTYAANIGFGAANNVFQPAAPVSSPSTASSTSTAATSSGTSSATGLTIATSTSASSGILKNSASALQTSGTAELLLASAGSSGTLLNLLA